MPYKLIFKADVGKGTHRFAHIYTYENHRFLISIVPIDGNPPYISIAIQNGILNMSIA